MGKDTNFRGLTIFNKVVYYTKGSGSNGVNTVYFVDTTGKACPTGVGLPEPGATLPASPLAYNAAVLAKEGLQPNNMCILKGFPTALKSKTAFPFGIWFANSHTLYVADEGNGGTAFSTTTGLYTEAAAQTTAGLQKWVFDSTANTWKLAYTRKLVWRSGSPTPFPDTHRRQPRHGSPVGARHRRPAQHRGQFEQPRHRDDLGCHLHRQRRRRRWC